MTNLPDEDLPSLQRQLAEARENLRIIEEREAEFPLSTDIPLLIVKEKRRLLNEIATLERQLAVQPTPPQALDAAGTIERPSPAARYFSKATQALLAGQLWEAKRYYEMTLHEDLFYPRAEEQLAKVMELMLAPSGQVIMPPHKIPRRIPSFSWVGGMLNLLILIIVSAGIVMTVTEGWHIVQSAATPTPFVIAFASPTAVPTPVHQPTSTTTPEPTATPSAKPPVGTETPVSTSSPTASPTETVTPRPLPTDTPRASQPLAADLSGRLAIPLMYGNEPKVYIVSTGGTLEGIVGAARQPDYSQDGKKLIVNGEGGTWDKLRILDPIGGAPFEIGDPALAGHAHPSWSPGGDKIIYDDATIDPAGCRIFTRDLNTNGPGTGPGTQLSAGVGRGELIGRNPLWTTQDRFIFRGCNTWEVGQELECGVWVMKGNNGTPHKLTANPDHIPTDVQANTVVYVSAERGDWSVYTLDVVSGATKQITEDGMNDGLAVTSPDGRSVAFLSDREGKLAVWYVGIRGGSARKLFELSPEWGQLRADGWAEERLAWGAD